MGGVMSILLVAILRILIYVTLAPLLVGFLKWVKCLLQNRRGPSLFQPYRNINKLLHKEVCVPTTSSIIFHITPYVVFTVTLVLGSIIPLMVADVVPIGVADFIVLVGFFALIRFFLALAGMDIGTAFGGMGSSREMMVSALAEPALLMAFFSLAMIAQSTNISTIINYCSVHPIFLHPSLIFAALGFAVVAVAENGRIPVDNPATHLELTMIHEAMILEYSGKYLALLEWASQIKFMLYAVLLIDLFFPWGIALQLTYTSMLLGLFWLVVKLLVLCVILALIETCLAKWRLFRVPYLLNLAFLLCLIGVLNHIILEVG